MRRAALATVTVLTLAACGPGDVHPGDDDAAPDGAAPGGSGLVFRFVAPDLGETIDDLTVSGIHLSVRDVRALGDAAPGDDRTTLDRGTIELPGDGAAEIRFDDAPPGRYSSFELEIDRSQDGESSWRMDGTVRVDGEDQDFVIDDEAAAPISLPLANLNLGAAEVATITIEIDVIGLASVVDWESLPPEDVLTVDDDSPELAAVHARLTSAFSVASVDIQ
jgi:hypothetical protein